MYIVGLGMTNPVAMRFKSNPQNEAGQSCPLQHEPSLKEPLKLKEPPKEDVYTPQKQEVKSEEAKPLGPVEKQKAEETESKQEKETLPHHIVKDGGAGKSPQKSATEELKNQPTVSLIA